MTLRVNQISQLHVAYTHPAGGPAPAWARFVATFCGIGYLKPGPGTFASLATALLWFGLGRLMAPKPQQIVLFVTAATVTLLGIRAASRVSAACGNKDPQFVVIDEVAGQLIAFIGVPLVWKWALASFILFRIFDMLKPPPVRQLERLPGGNGIVLDDVAAGAYVLVIMQVVIRVGMFS
jgi:phosphatidylglycerophosphatase A